VNTNGGRAGAAIGIVAVALLLVDFYLPEVPAG
jgi:hypothetical protein